MQPVLGAIRWQLTRRYSFIVSLTLLVFGFGVYLQVADGRDRLMRTQLQQISSAAASQMPLILHELAEYQEGSAESHRGEPTEIGLLDTQAINLAGKRIIWFDKALKEVSAYGGFKPIGRSLIPAGRLGQKQFLLLDNGLAYWSPVFVRPSLGNDAELKGYVVVALSLSGAQDELHRLRNGLLSGGMLAAITAILLSQWMVASSIKPVREQMERLVRFTADASHELRHPLTAIRAVLGSVRQGNLLQHTDPVLRDKLDLVDRAVGQMATLVDDLLLLARLDRSMPDKTFRINFDLGELIDDVIDLYYDRAKTKGVELISTVVKPAPVLGDPERLRQLFNNLLSNALRFSPDHAKVWIEMTCQGKTIQLAVEDEGPGIPPDQRQLVFERFWQADQARSGSSSGLGLAIALAIAQAHGGTLKVETGRQGGCRMVLCLPEG